MYFGHVTYYIKVFPLKKKFFQSLISSPKLNKTASMNHIDFILLKTVRNY